MSTSVFWEIHWRIRRGVHGAPSETKGEKVMRTHLIRTTSMSMLMLGFAGASVVGIGVGTAASATSGSVKGAYTVTYNWTGFSGGTDTLTLAKRHKFTDTEGGSGTYKYRHHTLTLTYANICGTVYTGTGTPSTGFSGTSIINNNAPECLPQGTTGTWSTGPKGAAAVGRPAVHSTASASGVR